MKIQKTRRGARLVQGGAVLSEILRDPGATHSLFDVLAAAIAMLGRGDHVGLLGFAGGGLIAPLRAMGCFSPVRAADLSLEGYRVFEELSGPWIGDVRVAEEDAEHWLRAQRKPFDVLLEDLSVMGEEAETKPSLSYERLPEQIAAKLAPTGIAIFNLLPVRGRSMRSLVRKVAAPFPRAVQVLFDDFENRLVIGGRELEAAPDLGRLLRRGLRGIDSEQSTGLSVRQLHPDAS